VGIVFDRDTIVTIDEPLALLPLECPERSIGLLAEGNRLGLEQPIRAIFDKGRLTAFASDLNVTPSAVRAN